MSLDEILGLLGQFNLIAWIIATLSAFMILKATKNRGWILIMIGSLFVVMRQLWKLFPVYKAEAASEVLMNGYMMRYVFGATGAVLLCAGFVSLIVSYYVLQSKMAE